MPLSSAEFKNAWSYTAIPVSAFMFLCLIKLKAMFPFTFNMQAYVPYTLKSVIVFRRMTHTIRDNERVALTALLIVR